MKKIVELSPLIGAFLVFTGFLRLYLVYQHWDIRIVDYLEFSEILLSFLHDLNIAALCLFIFIVHQLIGVSVVDYANKRSKGLVVRILDVGFHRYWRPMLIVSAIAAIVFTIFFLVWNHLPLLYIATAFSAQTFFIGADKMIQADEKYRSGVATVMTFLLLTSLLARRDIVTIEREATVRMWTIETDDNVIKTTSTLFLIGKSQNFIFLHDDKNHSTRIIAVDRVKSMAVQQ